MNAKTVRLLLLCVALAVFVWARPSTSYAGSCPVANCDVFVNECLDLNPTGYTYTIIEACGGTHIKYLFTCHYADSSSDWSDICWDN
jgi:hypothetical protein